ncbi:MAG: alpha/beta hydrolase [Ilumatobacter sp.]
MSMKDRAEALATRVVPRLPERLLRKMAGDPVVIDGRTLDVVIQLAAAQSATGPSIAGLDPVTARTVTAAAFASSNAKRAAGVSTQELTIDDDGPVVRIYRPASASGARPAMLFMHQGGFVIGDLDSCDSFCSRVAADLGAVVVSLQYRMGPEHLFPAPAEDADAAWAWMTSNAAGLGIDPTKIVVCGDSAGGQMGAALCQRLRETGGTAPTVQVLVYPWVDATASDGSIESCAGSFPLTTQLMDWFVSHAIPDDYDLADPALSPALAEHVGDVPPAIVVTAGFDPLRDQGIAFAAALKASGVAVTERCENSLSHSFLSLDGAVPEASAAVDRIIADIERHL